MSQPCLFCNIANGKVPDTKLEVETDEYVIFKDIKPAAKFHYLAVPKLHYESLNTLTKSHEQLVTRMEEGLRQLLAQQGVDMDEALFGFHLPPFITVRHLHMHAIAPRSDMGFLSRWIFKPSSRWFRSPDDARFYLYQKNE
ncbi:uncharacterized protein Dwil_GK10717 [Drosophila willistoni]|uniref:Adenosine 5'-monophosphoramidase HINT3 n=1 Tax=Drosophila willistoni TaxID=7260 RepID=B4N4F4_DROWI|nr:adenosine 5'-monophosphoramidase HINT3 [Drosophila willistoni]EDW79028.1 uncharacterized protein Dwil_GK10717 [Drosophila willistoni]